MHWTRILYSNVSILVYIFALYLFSLSFKINKPLSHNISDAVIPAPHLFTEFTHYYNQSTDENNLSRQNTFENSKWLEHRPYKRLVFMLLDAFRFDFVLHDPKLSKDEYRWVYTNKMTNLTQFLQYAGDKGMLFRLKSEIPTTTIARIKSIITGDSQAYLDIADNNNPQSINTDNLLTQFFNQKRRVVIMGDSLWTSLHKDVATRSFTSCGLNIFDNSADLQVYNNFFDELNRPDWDVIIAHMVGIDHFGHAHGIEHPSISQEIESYDRFVGKIIKKILTKEYQDTLLVLLSDHGVNSDGTHGGKAPEEVDGFLSVFNYNGFAQIDSSIEHILFCYERDFLQGYRQKHHVLNGECDGQIFYLASQNDLAPTISFLIGSPIPYNSTGKIIYEIFPKVPSLSPSSNPWKSDKQASMISRQRYYSQMCHINLYSVVRNFTKNYLGNEEYISSSASKYRHILMGNLFKLNKLRHLLLLFSDPNSITASNVEFHSLLLKSHLILCQKISTELSDSLYDNQEKFDVKTMIPLFLFLVLSLFELMSLQTMLEIISTAYFKILLTSVATTTLSFCLSEYLKINDDAHNFYFYFTAVVIISLFFPIIYCYVTSAPWIIDFTASNFSSAVRIIDNFSIPESVVIIFHLLTPFMESLVILYPRCYLTLVVYLLVHNLLGLENWNLRFKEISESRNMKLSFFYMLKKCSFLLKALSVGILMRILYWGRYLKYFSSFRFWCKITHLHPVPFITLFLICVSFKNNSLLSLSSIRIELFVWTIQAMLTSFYLSYEHGEMISLYYLLSQIVFILSIAMILFEFLRPLSSSSKDPLPRIAFKLHTISVHLFWPAFLLYGPSQSVNLLLSLVTEKLYFEVLKYTISESENYIVSPIHFAIVYFFLGEHFYYSTGHTNSFFTLPFNAAYVLTGKYTHYLSEGLITFNLFFFSAISAILYILTLNNYKAHLIKHRQLNSKMTLVTVVNRLSFGVYSYTLLSALILSFMKSHRLFYSTFLPSVVFTVCRASVFLVFTRLLFNIITLNYTCSEYV